MYAASVGQAPPLMQFLIVVLAEWLSRQQETFIAYLKAENRLLKARLGRRRLIFTDAERRLLARHAKAVGAKIQALVVRMASENPRWGYTRIQGAPPGASYDD